MFKKVYLICFLIIFSGLHLISGEIYKGEYKFYFGDGNKDGYVKVDNNLKYSDNSPYGFDLDTELQKNSPYFFSIELPEGNYRVTVVLGDKNNYTNTTIRSESRRLMLENINTIPGEFIAE